MDFAAAVKLLYRLIFCLFMQQTLLRLNSFFFCNRFPSRIPMVSKFKRLYACLFPYDTEHFYGSSLHLEKVSLDFWRQTLGCKARENQRCDAQCILGCDHVKKENVDGPMWISEGGDPQPMLFN